MYRLICLGCDRDRKREPWVQTGWMRLKRSGGSQKRGGEYILLSVCEDMLKNGGSDGRRRWSGGKGRKKA